MLESPKAKAAPGRSIPVLSTPTELAKKTSTLLLFPILVHEERPNKVVRMPIIVVVPFDMAALGRKNRGKRDPCERRAPRARDVRGVGEKRRWRLGDQARGGVRKRTAGHPNRENAKRKPEPGRNPLKIPTINIPLEQEDIHLKHQLWDRLIERLYDPQGHKHVRVR